MASYLCCVSNGSSALCNLGLRIVAREHLLVHLLHHLQLHLHEGWLSHTTSSFDDIITSILIAQNSMISSTNIKHGALMKMCKLLINNNTSRMHQSSCLKFNGSNHTYIQANKQEKKALKYRKLQ